MNALTGSDARATMAVVDEAFNAGDVDLLLSHYDPEAVLALEPGRTVAGLASLRVAFERLLQLAPQARCLRSQVMTSGDLALHLSQWQLSTPGVDGGETTRTGVATTVLRRDLEGQWRVVLDNPWGPEFLGLPSLMD